MATPSWKRIKTWTAIVSTIAMTAFALWLVVQAHLTGVYTGRGYPIRLAEDPERYWYYVNQMTFGVVVMGGFLALMLTVTLLGRHERGRRLIAYIEKRSRERQHGLEDHTAHRLDG
jgi:hypothetical protein